MRKSLRLSLLCGVAAPCLVFAASACAQNVSPDEPRQYELHRAPSKNAAPAADAMPLQVPVITPSQKPLSVTIPNAAAVEQPAQISGEMNTHDRYYGQTQEQLETAEKAKPKAPQAATPPAAPITQRPVLPADEPKPVAPVQTAAQEPQALPPLPTQLVQPTDALVPVQAQVQPQPQADTPVQAQLQAPPAPTHRLQALQPRKMPPQNPRQGTMFERAFSFLFGSDAPSDANPAPADLSTPPVVMGEQVQDAPEGTPPPSILMPAQDRSASDLPMTQEAKKGQPRVEVYASVDAEPAPIAPVQQSALPAAEQDPAPVVKVYRSPQAIINREVLHAEQPGIAVAQAGPQRIPLLNAEEAAQMRPAAGGMDEPLIATPPVASSPAPVQSKPETPPIVAAASVQNKPAESPMSSAPTVAEIPAAPETPAAPQPPMPPARAQLMDALMPEPATPVPPMVSASVPTDAIRRWQDGATPAPEVMPPVKPLLATPTAPAPVVVATPAPAAIVPDTSAMQSEPQPVLSDASKKIANKLPTNIGKKKGKTKEPVDIEHTRDTSRLLMKETPPPGPASSTMQNVMGVKMEVKTPPVNQDYELEKAYNAMLSGHSESAMEIYKNVLANSPDNKNALFGLATAYHRAGQIDQARPYYARLLAIDPNNRDGLNNFLVLLADEAPGDALNQLSALQQKNPQFSPIPAQMAIIYNKMGDFTNANANMLKAIDLAPENLTYRYNFAVMLDKQKRYAEAAQFYGEVVSAYQRGETVPGNIQKIQQRLTYIRSNRP